MLSSELGHVGQHPGRQAALVVDPVHFPDEIPAENAHGWRSAIVIAQQWHARRVRATFRRRWKGSGCRIYVVKAFSEYGGGSQARLNHSATFVAWDTAAFVASKIMGYA